MGQAGRSREQFKDDKGTAAVTGRHQRIPSRPTELFDAPTFAAGAVLWREGAKGKEFAVIHRPHYDDFSLAKGKVDPGESLPVTACREIVEETGFEVTLGQLLGHVTYPVGKRTKVVYYWLAEVTAGEFVPNKEVDVIEWLPCAQARERLSYELDRVVLDKAAKRLATAVDTRVIVVRHAQALKRRSWVGGDDDRRPLTRKGLRQVGMLPGLVGAFGPTRVLCAPPVRCVDTAAPIAAAVGVDVVVDEVWGDRAIVARSAEVFSRLAEEVAAGGVPVVVSQGEWIEQVLARLSAQGTVPVEDVATKKAGVWVLGFHAGQLAAADYYASPLPLK